MGKLEYFTSPCMYSVLQPAMNGKVDPAVLAALPPSMQLDLLVQVSELTF